MINEQDVSAYDDTAYKGVSTRALPVSPKERRRVGDELLPFESYAHAIPYHRTVLDVEALQTHEMNDPTFEDKDWWWNHQRINFLNGKLGLKILVLAIPIAWAVTVFVGGLALIVLGTISVSKGLSFPGILFVICLLGLASGWIIFALRIIPPTTNWIMSTGIGFLLKPFEKIINKKLDETLEDGCSEFNRVTGQVRIALGRGRYFEAPFEEFDAYIERIVQQGGIFYRLMLAHRYTQKVFNKTAFSSIEAEKHEVQALWDMLQCYMDVTQPLPDAPRLEPFRHLDPVTAEYDQKTGRNPRYWRDLDLAAWKDGEGLELLQRQREYPWGQRVCKLTPKLGQINMDTYREQRPATASAI